MLSFYEVFFIYQAGFELLTTGFPPSSIRLISRQFSTRAQTVKVLAMSSIALYKQCTDLVRNRIGYFVSLILCLWKNILGVSNRATYREDREGGACEPPIAISLISHLSLALALTRNMYE